MIETQIILTIEEKIEHTLNLFVQFIKKNYLDFFQHETVRDYIQRNDYIKEFIPKYYLFLKEHNVQYYLFEKIDKEKFIELALARSLENN